MSGFERVVRFEGRSGGLLRDWIYTLGGLLAGGDICRSLRAQVSAGPSRLGNCGNGMFEDQLIVRP